MSFVLHKHQMIGAAEEEGTTILMTQQSNPKVLAICYAQGWCEKSYKMTYAEAAAVTSIGTVFQNSSINSFNEFQYFTGITSLAERAFQGSTLTSIRFPNTISSLLLRTFYNCKKLSDVLIPSNITNIVNSSYLFSGCTSLLKIKWDSPLVPLEHIYLQYCREYDSNVYSVIDGILYNGNILFAIPRAWNKNSYILTVPNNITAIGSNAFQANSTIKELIINEGCTTIGSNSIYNCSALTTLTLPSTLTTINSRSVYTCAKLETIYIYSQQAPTCSATYAMSNIGSSATGTKTIHIVSGATGYTTSKWTALMNAGWNIVEDL